MVDTEEKERDAKYNSNNVTMYTFFNHSTISPSQGEISNVTSVHSTISPSQGEISIVTRHCYLKNKRTQRMRQSMRNLQLHMMYQSILTYSDVEESF